MIFIFYSLGDACQLFMQFWGFQKVFQALLACYTIILLWTTTISSSIFYLIIVSVKVSLQSVILLYFYCYSWRPIKTIPYNHSFFSFKIIIILAVSNIIWRSFTFLKTLFKFINCIWNLFAVKVYNKVCYLSRKVLLEIEPK